LFFIVYLVISVKTDVLNSQKLLQTSIYLKRELINERHVLILNYQNIHYLLIQINNFFNRSY